MSDVPLNKEEVTKLFKQVIREAGRDLEGDDKMLCKHLSNVIKLNNDFKIDDEDHVKSLRYLDKISGIFRKFDEEIASAVVRELGL